MELPLKENKLKMNKNKTSQICIMTVTGVDKVGIVAKLSSVMAKANINIVDINQKIMEEYFVMTMAVDIADATVDIENIKKRLDKVAKEMSLKITLQDENIFKTMHRV
jgi:ACT domain-containing protein